MVAPILILLMLILIDFGRGLLYYTEMATGVREAARQAVLQYNNRSNSAAPSCGTCEVPGVIPILASIAGFGYPAPQYAVSTSSTAAPWYGSYTPSATAGQPGTITLSSSAQPDTLYVFIYELDPTSTTPRFPTCDPCDGLRQGGGRRVVVDVKMRWQPVVLAYAGIGPSLTLDAQTVSREEW